MQKTIAAVVLDNAIDRPLDYTIPKDFPDLKIGHRVQVPLKSGSAKGTILELKEKSPFSPLKPLLSVLGENPLIPEDLFQLAFWIEKYYLTPLGKVLKTMLPPTVRSEKGKHKTQKFLVPLLSPNKMRDLCISLQAKRPGQAKVLELLLKTPKGLFLSEALSETGITHSPIETLAKQEVLSIRDAHVDRSFALDHEFFKTKPKILTEEQEKTLCAILETCGSFHPHLIHGITGSGKTEIYLQAIDHVIQKEKGVIYLVPEIALTTQMIERFKGRFGGENLAILHHRLSNGERFDAWHRIRSGKAKIVLGARSAIFSPVPNLGMIIVDEEHESTYKQSDESPKYHGRDVAVVRAKFANCPILLGSATPSVESYHNAITGKYSLHVLKNRADQARLPHVEILPMKKEFEKNSGFTLFSDLLINGIKKRLETGEQTLLFLNRRGYHTAAICEKCSYVLCCPHCDLSLTYHLGEEILACHLCDYRIPPPKECPECHAEGPLKFRGAGTEMVQKALHAILPDVRTLRLDADTTKHKGSHEKIFKQFKSGKADVLIGTQMIAKGLHFPLCTLVGVLHIDGSLNIPDFRASEQVFQLLTQVAGRSGRGELPGEVIIQTHLPNHPTIQMAAKQDYETFFSEEIEVRKLFVFPPFSHLIKCTFSSDDLDTCTKRATQFRKELIHTLHKGVEILPLIPCGYARIKGNYRLQFLMKVEKIGSVLQPLGQLRKQFGQKKDVRLSVDVDPLTTFF